jgi:alkylation response protein AidB-like acyl-CoA dehydrogenase
MTMTTTSDLLTDDMLARFDERAPVYDRENRFFDEDFEELKASGFLTAAVPTDMGGSGLALDAYSKLARRLAYYAPATAVAVNMHVYWTGVAADLLRSGDESCRWILEKAAAGEVFAAIHGEAGNDLPLFLSSANAERVEGGWLISGHKIFGSLSPVWTYAGFHAMDVSDPSAPRIVHGFLPRTAKGYQIVDTWDTLGMRATQSQDTVLDNASCPTSSFVGVSAGFAGAGMFQLSIFAALMGFASVYLGAARRAFDYMAKLPSDSVAHCSMAHHPECAHRPTCA